MRPFDCVLRRRRQQSWNCAFIALVLHFLPSSVSPPENSLVKIWYSCCCRYIDFKTGKKREKRRNGNAAAHSDAIQHQFFSSILAVCSRSPDARRRLISELPGSVLSAAPNGNHISLPHLTQPKRAFHF